MRILVLILVLMIATPAAFAVDLIDNEPSLRSFKYTVIQKNTYLKVVLMSNISSEVNNVGDRVRFFSPFDITLEQTIVIPVNSIFIGHISEVAKAEQGRDGLLKIDVDEIRYPNGSKKKIEAHVYSKVDNGLFGGKFTNRSGFRKVVHKSESFGPGVLQAVPDGPRLFGKEMLLKSGLDMVIQIDSDIRKYIIPE